MAISTVTDQRNRPHNVRTARLRRLCAVAPLLLVAGCAGSVNMDIFHRELRWREDQIYHLKGIVEDRDMELDYLRAENSRLRQEIGLDEAPADADQEELGAPPMDPGFEPPPIDPGFEPPPLDIDVTLPAPQAIRSQPRAGGSSAGALPPPVERRPSVSGDGSDTAESEQSVLLDEILLDGDQLDEETYEQAVQELYSPEPIYLEAAETRTQAAPSQEADGSSGEQTSPAPDGSAGIVPGAASQRAAASDSSVLFQPDGLLVRAEIPQERKDGDVLRAIVSPRAAGRRTGFEGTVNIMVLDPAAEPSERNLARWDFDAREVRESWAGGGNRQSLRFDLYLPEEIPRQAPLELWVRLFGADGSKVLEHIDVDLQQLASRPEGSTGSWVLARPGAPNMVVDDEGKPQWRKSTAPPAVASPQPAARQAEAGAVDTSNATITPQAAAPKSPVWTPDRPGSGAPVPQTAEAEEPEWSPFR